MQRIVNIENSSQLTKEQKDRLKLALETSATSQAEIYDLLLKQDFACVVLEDPNIFEILSKEDWVRLAGDNKMLVASMADKIKTPHLSLTSEQIFKLESVNSIKLLLDRFGLDNLNGSHLDKLIAWHMREEKEVDDNSRYVSYKSLIDLIESNETKANNSSDWFAETENELDLVDLEKFYQYVDGSHISASQLTNLLLTKPAIISREVIKKLITLELLEANVFIKNDINELTDELKNLEILNEVPTVLFGIISEYCIAKYNADNLIRILDARPELALLPNLAELLILHCYRDNLYPLLVKLLNPEFYPTFYISTLMLENNILSKLSGKELSNLYNKMDKAEVVFIKDKLFKKKNTHPEEYKNNTEHAEAYDKLIITLNSCNPSQTLFAIQDPIYQEQVKTLFKTSRLSGKDFFYEELYAKLEISGIGFSRYFEYASAEEVYKHLLTYPRRLYFYVQPMTLPFNRYQIKTLLLKFIREWRGEIPSENIFKPILNLYKNENALSGYDLVDIVREEHWQARHFKASDVNPVFLKALLEVPELLTKYHHTLTELENINFNEEKHESIVNEEQRAIFKFSNYYLANFEKQKELFAEINESKESEEIKDTKRAEIRLHRTKAIVYLKKGVSLGIVPCFENLLKMAERAELEFCLNNFDKIVSKEQSKKANSYLYHFLNSKFKILHNLVQDCKEIYEKFISTKANNPHKQEIQFFNEAYILERTKLFYNIVRETSFIEKHRGNFFGEEKTYEQLDSAVCKNVNEQTKTDRKSVCMELATILYHSKIGYTHLVNHSNYSTLKKLTDSKYEKVLLFLLKEENNSDPDCKNTFEVINKLFSLNGYPTFPIPIKAKTGFLSGLFNTNNNTAANNINSVVNNNNASANSEYKFYK